MSETQLFVYWCLISQKEQCSFEKVPQYLIGPREELRKVILEDYSSAWQFAFIFYSLSVALSHNQRYIPWKPECVSPHKFISLNFQFCWKINFIYSKTSILSLLQCGCLLDFAHEYIFKILGWGKLNLTLEVPDVIKFFHRKFFLSQWVCMCWSLATNHTGNGSHAPLSCLCCLIHTFSTGNI